MTGIFFHNSETIAVCHVYVTQSSLQSNQVKRIPQEPINEFIIRKLNPLLVVDFRLISAFLHV